MLRPSLGHHPHRLGRLVCTAIATAALLVISAAPALADPPNVAPPSPSITQAYVPTGTNPAAIPLTSSQCAIYTSCMWADASYSGYFWAVSGNNSSWNYVGSNFNDKASSIWNRRSGSFWVDRDANPVGAYYVCIGGGGGWYYPNLHNNHWYQSPGPNANDSISAYWLPSGYVNCQGEPQFLPGS